MQDPRKFAFSTDYPMPNFVYKTLTKVTAAARATNTTVIPHGLPFVPLIVGQWSPNEDFSTTHDISNSSSVDSVFCWCFADSENIYIRQFNGINDNNTIYVKIFAYPAPEYSGHLQYLSDETVFNFSSDYEYLGIYKQGHIDSDGKVHTIQHGLGYIPQCKIWCGGNFAVDGYTTGVKAVAPVSSFINTSRHSPNYAVNNNELIIGQTYETDGRIYYHIYTNEA